jgi:hypothetical protein
MAYGSWITIAVVLIIVVALFFLIRAWLANPLITSYPDLNDENFVKLLRDYETWYAKSSRRCTNTLVVCRITPLVMGFVVAVVSAANKDAWPLQNYIDQSILVIILTGISSLAVAIVTQLGLGDLAKARENGRIASAHLVARTQLMFAKPTSPEKLKITE